MKKIRSAEQTGYKGLLAVRCSLLLHFNNSASVSSLVSSLLQLVPLSIATVWYLSTLCVCVYVCSFVISSARTSGCVRSICAVRRPRCACCIRCFCVRSTSTAKSTPLLFFVLSSVICAAQCFHCECHALCNVRCPCYLTVTCTDCASIIRTAGCCRSDSTPRL